MSHSNFWRDFMDTMDIITGLFVVAFLYLVTRDEHNSTSKEVKLLVIGIIALIVIGRVYNSGM